MRLARDSPTDQPGVMSSLRVLIISFTDTTAEPRVRRQLTTLDRLKVPFVVASFAQHGSHHEASGFIALKGPELPTTTKPSVEQCKTGQRSWKGIGSRLCEHFTFFFRRLLSLIAGFTYHLLPLAGIVLRHTPVGKLVSRLWFRLGWHETRDYSRRIKEHLRLTEFEPNLVIFHDYFTSKLAFDLSEKFGAKTLFDVHEHATSQYSKQAGWLKFVSPLVRDIEEDAAKKSDAIITVGEEIQKLLGQQYGQWEKTHVVRSVSEFSDQSFRPSSYPLKLLYSGAISPERGLTELVQSMVQLQDRFTLTIKGPVTDPKFEVSLRELVSYLNLGETVKLELPCEYQDIVRHANTHDIGVFVQPDSSKHKIYTLPNKFFSYIAAGLALCVSDYPELARIARQWGFAILVNNCSPESIATALGELSTTRVDELKKMALTAARELNWQKEELVLIKVLRALETGQQTASGVC